MNYCEGCMTFGFARRLYIVDFTRSEKPGQSTYTASFCNGMCVLTWANRTHSSIVAIVATKRRDDNKPKRDRGAKYYEEKEEEHQRFLDSRR